MGPRHLAGTAALATGFGELRYAGRAFQAPGVVESALSGLGLAVPVAALVWVLRRYPGGERIPRSTATFVGLGIGLAGWILVLGPWLLPG